LCGRFHFQHPLRNLFYFNQTAFAISGAIHGAEIVASNPKDFAKFLQKEFAKWEDVVRKAGIQKQ